LANKKIWAYALDGTGQYVKGDKHPLRIFFIWETLKIRDNKVHEFNKLKFMSTQKDPSKRLEMSAVKNGFYRYKIGGDRTDNNFDKDGDSLSHSIAIQVLSEMDEINFVCGKDKYTLKVKNIRSDDLKLQLTNRGKFDYYYPDLICAFNNPKDLALKWDSKLAIEVKHTHACENEKIQDFESHGIPIIEVNIENISIEKKFNTKHPTPELLEQYYNYLKNTFGNQVYGKILSNPVSAKYFKKKEDEFIRIAEKNKVELNSLRKSNSQEIEASNRIIAHKEKKIIEHEKKILEIEKRGLRYFIAKALGFNR